MKKILLTGIIAVFALTAVAVPAMAKSDKAKGPVDKATGEITWESSTIIRSLSFNAHELNEETNEAKGWAYYSDNNGDTFTVRVDYAEVDENHACFWGETTEGTGSFASREGQTRYWYVIDGGEPQMDEVRGRWSTSNQCNNLDDNPHNVTMGNLQVHTY